MRIAVKDAKTGEVLNVLVFDGDVPEPPKGLVYVEDRARAASIGQVQSDQELLADPEPEPPEEEARNPLAELDALKAKLVEKNVLTEQEIKQHGLG